MQGVVIQVRPRGIRVQMDTAGQPAQRYSVFKQSDQAVVLTNVVYRKSFPNNVHNFNWENGQPPANPVSVGDIVKIG